MDSIYNHVTEKTSAQTIINCINDAVILFRNRKDLNPFSFQEANKAALNLFGYTREEFLRLTLPGIFDRITYKRFLEAKNLINTSEGCCINKAGKLFPVEFYSNCSNPEGNTSILVIKDVTQKKEYEEQLSRYIQELHENKDLMERNGYELVLLNAKLEESEEQLKALNSSKDKFFSIIAHDLRNPFTSFLGLTELLIEDFDLMKPDEIKKHIIELNKSANNFYSLLENLLNWSIVQTGRMDFSPGLVSPKELLNNIEELFEASTAQKKIGLTVEVTAVQNIYADRNMIETVIRNLVSNAIKFTPEEGHITIKVVDTEDNVVRFSVQDTGIGMDGESLSKLFRIDSHHTTPGTKNEQGTGLGLILCKELIEINNGSISVESESGAGTKFIFSLPVKKPAGKE